VTAEQTRYSLAAVLSAGEPERLYSGLSVLVSAATEGEPCAALASFRALGLILDPDLARLAQEPEATPGLSWAGRETFGRSLGELRDAALSLDALRVYACSASVDTMVVTAADVEARLAGVMSTPRFLRETAGARLIFV
jgi:peroxiredoxin family protein